MYDRLGKLAPQRFPYRGAAGPRYLLSTNTTSRTERERVGRAKFVGAILFIHPSLRNKLVRVLEVPLTVSCSPHWDRNRGLSSSPVSVSRQG